MNCKPKKLQERGIEHFSIVIRIYWKSTTLKEPKSGMSYREINTCSQFQTVTCWISKNQTPVKSASHLVLLANNLCGRSPIFQLSTIYKLQPLLQVNRRWPALSGQSNYPVINVWEMTGDGWDWVLSPGTAGRRTTLSRIRPFTGHSRHCASSPE